MDFTLDKKHEMARQLFKDFAENEVKPVAQETDETESPGTRVPAGCSGPGNWDGPDPCCRP